MWESIQDFIASPYSTVIASAISFYLVFMRAMVRGYSGPGGQVPPFRPEPSTDYPANTKCSYCGTDDGYDADHKCVNCGAPR